MLCNITECSDRNALRKDTKVHPNYYSINTPLLSFLSVSISFQAMYMFIALALVCDDYFVPSLEKICEVSMDKDSLHPKRQPIPYVVY